MGRDIQKIYILKDTKVNANINNGIPWNADFVNCRQFMYLVISLFGFEGRIWDLIVSVPDHCLSFYFKPNVLFH